MFEVKPLLPGILGALLAAFTGPQRSHKMRALEFAFGFCVALFGTEPVLDIFALAADKYSGGVGFALGYFGMTIAQAILRLFNDTDWGKAVSRRLGGGE